MSIGCVTRPLMKGYRDKRVKGKIDLFVLRAGHYEYWASTNMSKTIKEAIRKALPKV